MSERSRDRSIRPSPVGHRNMAAFGAGDFRGTLRVQGYDFLKSETKVSCKVSSILGLHDAIEVERDDGFDLKSGQGRRVEHGTQMVSHFAFQVWRLPLGGDARALTHARTHTYTHTQHATHTRHHVSCE